MEIVNLPVGDKRLGDFASDLHDFILERGYGLPYPAILGSIDIVKMKIMQKQDEDLND